MRGSPSDARQPGADKTGQFGVGLFPVRHSILAADALLAEVRKAYAVAEPVGCELLGSGLNDTYRLVTRDGRYIVRVYKAHRRTVEEISYELELLRHLAAKGVSVSLPIAGKDGRWMRALPAPEGPRELVLFTYADGKPLSWDDEHHLYLMGNLAAKIHSASDDFVSRHPRLALDLDYLIERPLEALRPFLAHRREDWNYLEGFAKRLRVRAEEVIATGPDWGVCHGDYGAKNIHIAEGDKLTGFDFDFCGPGWRAYDFAVIRWAAVGKGKDALWVWDAFLRGYTEQRPLTAATLAAVPPFYAISHLWVLGVSGSAVAEWGTFRMSDSNLDRELRFFQEWDADHLRGGSRSTFVDGGGSRAASAVRGVPPEPPGERQRVQRGGPASGRSSGLAMSHLFPVRHSILAADAVLAEVSETYAVPKPVGCQLLRSGLNDTYMLVTRGDRYIARVYKAHRRTVPEIAYELELLRHLGAKGVSVSLPIAGKDGRWMRALPAPEGPRQLVLFTYADGKPLSWDNEHQLYLAGNLAARIHTASDDFASRHARFALDLDYLIERPLEALRPFLAHRREDWDYLEGFAKRLRAHAEEVVAAGLDWGVCHGDFGRGNIHITEDGKLTIFDFDFCGPGWRAYDFCGVEAAAAFHESPGLCGAFMDGYRALRPLEPADFAAVPILHPVSYVFFLGVVASNALEWGTVSMSDWYINNELEFFRNWEAEHLEGDQAAAVPSRR